MNYYPSIIDDFYLKALSFVKTHIKIAKKETEIMMHSCDSHKCSKNNTADRDSKNVFGIGMASFHGAETCNLVRLEKLKIIIIRNQYRTT